MNRLDRIRFVDLRHKEYDLVREVCEADERQIRWAVGDMWYDWQLFAKMKKNDILIIKIHKGGTHCFPESVLKDYVNALNPSKYFKVTCYDDREGKPDWEGDDYTIEPYDVKEGD